MSACQAGDSVLTRSTIIPTWSIIDLRLIPKNGLFDCSIYPSQYAVCILNDGIIPAIGCESSLCCLYIFEYACSIIVEARREKLSLYHIIMLLVVLDAYA